MVKTSGIDLHEYLASEHSQYGEDGILKEIFRLKDVAQGYFCEFGAWDGKHVSNTYALYEKGWKGCYIEGDAERHKDLLANITAPGMALVCAFVTPSGENRLDAILQRSMPKDTSLDLLSIDIDSDDLAIWKSLEQIRPKVVVIEYNPTIPTDVAFENIPGRNHGNSALAIVQHGVSQGYELVAQTTTNLILMAQEFNNGAFRTFSGEELGRLHGVRYFFGYDGALLMANLATGQVVESEFYSVPWSEAVFTQPLSKPFRRFQDPGAGRMRSMLSRLSATFRRPLSAAQTRFSVLRGHRSP